MSLKTLSLGGVGFIENPGELQYVTVRTGPGENDWANVLLGDFRTFMTEEVNTRIDNIAGEIGGDGIPSIWPAMRTITLSGAVTGSASFDGSANFTVNTTVADGALSIAKISGLQAALDAAATKNNPTFTGTITLQGDMLPDLDNVRSLGSPELMWRDVYIGPGSLYINGQKVLEENDGTIRVTADPGQNIAIQTSGTGDIEVAPQGTGVIQLKGSVSFLGGSKIRSSNGTALLFDDNISFSAGVGLTGPVTIDGNAVWHAGNLTPVGAGTDVRLNSLAIGADNDILLSENGSELGSAILRTGGVGVLKYFHFGRDGNLNAANGTFTVGAAKNAVWHAGNFDPAANAYLDKPTTQYGANAGANCDLFVAGGKHLVHSTGNSNTPGTSSVYWYVETLSTITGDTNLLQRAYGSSADEVYIRRCAAGVWSTWRRQWNSSNFDPTSKLDSNAVAASAVKLQTARTIALSGLVTATGVGFDGTGNISLTTDIADAALTIAKVSGLQTALNNKLGTGFAATDYMGSNPTEAGGGNDFNTMAAGTRYYIPADMAAANKPPVGSAACYVETLISGGGVMRIQRAWDENGVTYVRTRNLASTWSEWRTVWDSENFDPGLISGSTASKLETPRAIALVGPVNGAVNFDGSTDVTINTSVADGSLSIAKTSGLQTALDSKMTFGNSLGGNGYSDWDAINASGFYRMLGNISTGAPTDGADHDLIHLQAQSGDASQLAFTSDNILSFRVKDNGTSFTAWRTIYHSNNLSTIPAGALTIAQVANLQSSLNGKLDTGATAATATSLATARSFSLTGVVTAAAISFNGNNNVALSTAIADAALTIAKTSGLQAALDAKLAQASYTTDAASLPTAYPNNAVSTGGLSANAPTPGSIATHITARSNSDNRVGQLAFSTGGGTDVPDVWFRTHHTTNGGGGGWTAYQKLFHSGNIASVPDATFSIAKVNALQGILDNAMTQGASIGDAADLNTYMTTGWYRQGLTAQAGTGSNYPIALAGLLKVYSQGNMIWQEYTVYYSGSTYRRSYYSSSGWSPWYEMYDSRNFNPSAPTFSGTVKSESAGVNPYFHGKRTNSTINVIFQAETTAGSVYFGHGRAGRFAVGSAADLSLTGNRWFEINENEATISSGTLFLNAAGTEARFDLTPTGGGRTIRLVSNTTPNTGLYDVTNSAWLLRIDGSNNTELAGNLTLPSSGVISMGANTRQMLNLYQTSYGIGVQSSTLYFRSGAAAGSGGGFAWHRGGTHATGVADPGSGGVVLAQLMDEGNFRATGELQSIAANGMRMVQGSYGLIFRQDGSNFYLLPTASGDQYGSWNSLRPLTINMASGGVSMAQGLSVTGGNITATNVVSGSRLYAGWDSGTANSVSCSGWFRASGQTGLYCSDYGGGIYMTDTTYVRAYNGKQMAAADFVISSDKRLKKDIRPFEFRGRLRPVNFSMIESGVPDIGFLADDVLKLYPEAVGKIRKDGGLLDGKEVKQLSQAKLTAVISYQVNRAEDDIVKLQKRNDKLSKDNVKLKSDVKSMGARLARLERQLAKLAA